MLSSARDPNNEDIWEGSNFSRGASPHQHDLEKGPRSRSGVSLSNFAICEDNNDKREESNLRKSITASLESLSLKGNFSRDSPNHLAYRLDGAEPMYTMPQQDAMERYSRGSRGLQRERSKHTVNTYPRGYEPIAYLEGPPPPFRVAARPGPTEGPLLSPRQQLCQNIKDQMQALQRRIDMLDEQVSGEEPAAPMVRIHHSAEPYPAPPPMEYAPPTLSTTVKPEEVEVEAKGKKGDADGDDKRKRRKYRRPKDCDLPKKPKTGYTFFQLSVMERTWKEIEALATPGETREKQSRDVARLTGQRWRAMSEEERAKFKKMADEDAARYKQECMDYAQQHGASDYKEYVKFVQKKRRVADDENRKFKQKAKASQSKKAQKAMRAAEMPIQAQVAWVPGADYAAYAPPGHYDVAYAPVMYAARDGQDVHHPGVYPGHVQTAYVYDPGMEQLPAYYPARGGAEHAPQHAPQQGHSEQVNPFI